MTEATETKLPEVRFNGFEEAWVPMRLGQTCLIGDVDHWMPKSVPQGVPYVMTGDFCGVNDLNFEAKQISIEDFEELAKKICPEKGDILFARYASIGAVRYIETDRKFMASYSCAILKNRDRDAFNTRFLFFLIQSERYQRKIKLLINLGSQSNIGNDSLNNFRIVIPPCDEQSQIGSYFRSLDRMIELHQRKHDKLVTLKQAMLQKMFPQDGATTPEIRFKGFEGDWVESELQSEVEFFSGLTYSPHHVREKGGTLVLRSSNVKNGRLVDADNVYVESSVVDCEQVRVGDIVVVVRNGSRSLIGKHAPVVEEMNDTVIGAFMTGIRSTQSGFINALLDTADFMRQINENTGATINQITTGVFKKMLFRFPEPEEQELVGNYFRNLDKLISKHATQLKKLKNIKSACLEKMFV